RLPSRRMRRKGDSANDQSCATKSRALPKYSNIEFTSRRRSLPRRSDGGLPREGGLPLENLLVDLLRVAEDDELEISHVAVRDAANVLRRHAAQPLEQVGAAAPSAADQLVARKRAGLRGVGLLIQIMRREKTLCNGFQLVGADLLRLQPG